MYLRYIYICIVYIVVAIYMLLPVNLLDKRWVFPCSLADDFFSAQVWWNDWLLQQGFVAKILGVTYPFWAIGSHGIVYFC